MPSNPIIGNSGVKTSRTATHRKVVKADPEYLPGGVTIDGSKARDSGNTGDLDILRAGLVMGKITSGGKFAPSILGATGVLHDTSAVTTTMTLPAAIVTEIQRRIGASGTFKITGPPAASGTVATEEVTYSAIASSTTLTITATSADFAAGSFIQPNDGSEIPLCLTPDGFGTKVTDSDSADVDVDFPTPLIGGVIDSSQIIDWPTDTSLIAWLKSQLNAASGSRFVFDDAFAA